MSASTAKQARPPLLRRVVAAPVEFGRDWLVRFVELQGFDRAVALGGQAFTALIPLLIVYSSVVSKAGGRDFADRLVEVFDLSDDAAASLRQAFAPPEAVESQITALGVLLLVFAALSFTRALQRLYQLTWDQPPLGVRAAKWGLIWLVVVIAALTVRPLVLSPWHGITRIVMVIAVGAVIWLATPYILLARRLPWRRLLPAALLTSIGMTTLAVASAIWMPRSVSTSAEQFGTIGVAFALLGWLVGAGFVLVVASAGGRVIDDRLRARAARRSSAAGFAPVTREGDASSPGPGPESDPR